MARGHFQQRLTFVKICLFTFLFPLTLKGHRRASSYDDVSVSEIDPNSFSNPHQIYAKSYHFDLDVNFDKKVLSGSITYELVARERDVKEIIFDTSSKMKIRRVTSIGDNSSDGALNWKFGKRHKIYGKPLIVTLPDFEGTKKIETKIVIEYETSPAASGLQWIPPAQTAGKKHPFLFSLNSPIQARSWFPCQDTPFTRSTFTASVSAPKQLMVLMSAISSGKPRQSSKFKNKLVHKWSQSVPLATYIVAIVVGHLDFRDLTNFSRVWAEPPLLNAGAAKEFEDIGKMMDVAVSIAGKYIWGRYDMVLLPPSFPYGGMENGCLTYLFQNIVTGDKSLLYVVAHEIAHSWVGNQVGIKNLEHFWLKEGWATFLEMKILGKVYGEPERQLQEIQALFDLKSEVNRLKKTNQLTKLVTNLDDLDPNLSYNFVPYNKGNFFISYLETKIGADLMETFVKAYVKKFSLKSIDTDQWKQFFVHWLQKWGQKNLIKNVDWDTWLHEPGMPVKIPKFDRTLYNACVRLRNRWVKWDPQGSRDSRAPFSAKDVSNFRPTQKQIFLQLVLHSKKPLSVVKLKKMDKFYKFQESRNIEIFCRWIRCGLRVKWKAQVNRALQLVTEYGRLRCIQPIYEDLYKWGGKVRKKAVRTFKNNRPNMVTIAIKAVKKTLHLT